MRIPTVWRLTAALSAVMAFAVLPSFSLGTLAPFLRVELGISEAQVGLLFASFFAVTGLAAPLAGQLADRWGSERVIKTTLGMVAVLAALMAAAPNALVLGILFAITGLAYSGANPGTNAFIQAHLHRARGLVLGVKQAGIPLAAFLAGFLLPPIAERAGWRLALVLPVVGILAALAWFSFTLRRHPSSESAGAVEGSVAGTVPVAGTRTFLALAGYAFCLAAAESSLQSYLVLYLHDSVGYSITVAGAALGVAGLVGIGSRVLWAWLADTVFDGRAWVVLTGVGVGAAIGLASILLQPPGGSRVLLWSTAVLFGMFLFGAGGALGIAILQLAGDRAGFGTGVTYAGFYGGLTLGPIVFGQLISLSGYRAGWISSLVLMAAGTLLAATAVRRASRPAIQPA